MVAKKLNGEFFLVRNSNHKYKQLDDIDDIKQRLKFNCPADVAKELQVPYNSLMHVIKTRLTPEEQELIPWKRRRHYNRKKSDKIV